MSFFAPAAYIVVESVRTLAGDGEARAVDDRPVLAAMALLITRPGRWPNRRLGQSHRRIANPAAGAHRRPVCRGLCSPCAWGAGPGGAFVVGGDRC